MRLLWLAIAGVVMLAGSASASEAGDRQAYGYAIKCFVVNAVAADNDRERGNAVRAAAFDAKSKHSFDGAVTIGRKLGLSNRQMNHDFDEAQAVELPHMVRDATYYESEIGTCKALRLM